ncbi:hypothetical protein B0H14DRAFT_3475291 [Mycena olivaceomarginata]|nr:hypothetical protein B0H14DRAFT_3475291 [Mycena olivaceomarginata]
MHRDHPHCPLPAPVFCSSTTPNATRSGTTKPLPVCLTRLVLRTSLPTLYHVHTHLTSAHHRYAALSFLDARVALVSDNPLRTAAGYSTPLPSVGPAASIPRRIRCFPRHTPAATISGTASLSSSLTPGLLAQRLSRASHTTTVFSRIPPSPLGGCASVHPQPGVHDHRPPRPFLLAGVPLVASALAATSSVGAILLQACIRHSAETRRAASASSAASAAPVAYLLRRLCRLTPCCDVPVRRAHHMRQSLPIPSAPFSASPPFLIAYAYRIPAAATTLCVSTQLIYAHFGISAPPPLAQRAVPGSEEGQCGRLQREIAAHTQREDTSQWAPAAIAGTVRA